MPRKNFKTLSSQVRSDPKRAERVDEHKRAIADSLGLGELRAHRDATQVSVAENIGISQARVSTIERQEDLYLSTLDGYVAALGGKLEVRAVFDDETVELIPHREAEPA
jgi:DNA-binding Xre family transcriptional regulator